MLGIAALAVAVLTFHRPLARELTYPVKKFKALVAGRFKESAEVSRLKREIQTLSLTIADMDRLEAENSRLRRALEFKDRQKTRYLAASVLSRGGAAVGHNHLVAVDKGSLSGVRPGACVMAVEGLVGIVASTSLHTSEIALLTDDSVKVSAMVEGPHGDNGYAILAGGNEDVLHLKYLTGNGQLAASSRVLTSGLGGVYPKGLVIGTLVSREGEVRPAVDFRALEEVFIRCEE